MSDDVHFAILAPVPLEHLKSGLAVCHEQGSVAFGTMKWELFRQIDELREGSRVAALIYPSHEENLPAKDSFIVTWFGWYTHFRDSKDAMNSDAMLRPPPTKTDGRWAIFWHVAGLRELPKSKQLPIKKIQGFKGWRKNPPPRGPELVTLPELLSYEN
jgi:hypothetical protein